MLAGPVDESEHMLCVGLVDDRAQGRGGVSGIAGTHRGGTLHQSGDEFLGD